MKKHLLSIITTALVVVNLIMSIVIVFTVLPTTSKINNLVTQICAALALDLEPNEEGSLKIAELEEIPLEDELTINLKNGSDGDDHYVIAKIAIIVNNTHKDYDKYKSSITEKSSLINDAIISEMGSFTIDEMKQNPDAVQEAVLERLQKLFNSRFIVKVAFKEIVYQ